MLRITGYTARIARYMLRIAGETAKSTFHILPYRLKPCTVKYVSVKHNICDFFHILPVYYYINFKYQ
jgi:hypothetical protein